MAAAWANSGGFRLPVRQAMTSGPANWMLNRGCARRNSIARAWIATGSGGRSGAGCVAVMGRRWRTPSALSSTLQCKVTALAAARDGTVTFVPGRWQKVYEHWMENIRDWCISRQLWWGHRIPVWYCQDCGETIVARDDPDSCSACGSQNLEQDPDVLDTWFSSWLWPFSIFGWPDDTDDLKAFYPGHVLSTAPEILFFWVARMIMAGYEFLGEAPFKTVYLHATVRDNQGRKMSKSLGNGIDPLEVVDQFGADALRFTVISAAAVGTDIQLDPEDLEASFAPGRNFANKVWNAGRFALMSVGDAPIKPMRQTFPANGPSPAPISIPCRSNKALRIFASSTPAGTRAEFNIHRRFDSLAGSTPKTDSPAQSAR